MVVTRRRRFRWSAVAAAVASLTLTTASTAQSALVDALRKQATTCPERHLANCGEDICWPTSFSFRVYESQGLRILVAAGGIGGGDAARLDSFLRSAGRVDEIWLDSPGGNAAEGPEIGKVIRNHRLATRVPTGFQCISSCTLAFLGGIVRHIDHGGAYGVHTFFTDGADSEVLDILADKSRPFPDRMRKLSQFLADQEQGSAMLAVKWQAYTQQMGVSRDLLSDVIVKQKSLTAMLINDNDVTAMQKQNMSAEAIAKALQTYSCPTAAQLIRYNVVNTSS